MKKLLALGMAVLMVVLGGVSVAAHDCDHTN